MYNTCIKQGIYPKCLKVAQVIPIHYKNSKYECTNYRPISLLCHLTKIFEKLVAQRVTKYLTKFQLLSECQYGFREGYSTTTAIADIYDLLKKIQNIGIRSTPLKLLESYLTDRMKYTSINGTTSLLQSIQIGIPQGSTFGLLLFLIFINDLPLASSFKTTLFADDAMLTLCSTNLIDLERTANLEQQKYKIG